MCSALAERDVLFGVMCPLVMKCASRVISGTYHITVPQALHHCDRKEQHHLRQQRKYHSDLCRYQPFAGKFVINTRTIKETSFVCQG